MLNKLSTSAGHQIACCCRNPHTCQHNQNRESNKYMQIQIQSARLNNNSNSISKSGYSTSRQQRQSCSISSLNNSSNSKSKSNSNNKCDCNCKCKCGTYNCKSSCKKIMLQSCQCRGADRRNMQQNCNRSCSRQKILQDKIQHMLKKQQLKLVQINSTHTHTKIKFTNKPKQSNCLQQHQHQNQNCRQKKQACTPISQNYCYYSQLQLQPISCHKNKIIKNNCIDSNYSYSYNVAERQDGKYGNKDKSKNNSKYNDRMTDKFGQQDQYQDQYNKQNNAYINRHLNTNMNQIIPQPINKNSTSYNKFDPLKSNKLSLRHYLNQTPQKQHKPSPFMNQIPLINQSASQSRSINNNIDKSKGIKNNDNSQQQQQQQQQKYSQMNTKNNKVLKQVRQLKGIFMQFINQKSQAKTRRKSSNFAKQFKDLIQQHKQTFTLP